MAIGFKGYAIVSADGFIADAAGRMPETLRFDADWTYFQAGLDAADLTLLGRHTHEAAPNPRGRRRLVVSRGVRAVIREDERTWWANSEDVMPRSAVAAAIGTRVTVAVVGGTGVFGWILDDAGYDEFHISVAHDVSLGAGRPLLDGVRGLEAGVDRLVRAGMVLENRSWLDREAALELLLFRIDGPGAEDDLADDEG